MRKRTIDAVIRKLDALFGDDCAYYSEDVEQDLQTPCLVVQSLTASSRQYLGGRRHLSQAFDILYIPASDHEPRDEIHRVQDILLREMEYIEMDDGGLLRGTGMRCETVDRVGHFLVDYNAMMHSPAEHNAMETLEYTPKTKGSGSDG